MLNMGIIIVRILAIIGSAIALSACALVTQPSTPTPVPTPTPWTVQECYDRIEVAATARPALFQRALKDEEYFRCRGQVTNTAIGEIEFHLNRGGVAYVARIKCEMLRERDAENVAIGQTIAVHGRIKDAFKEDALLGTIVGLRDSNIIELKDCVIIGD